VFTGDQNMPRTAVSTARVHGPWMLMLGIHSPCSRLIEQGLCSRLHGPYGQIGQIRNIYTIINTTRLSVSDGSGRGRSGRARGSRCTGSRCMEGVADWLELHGQQTWTGNCK